MVKAWPTWVEQLNLFVLLNTWHRVYSTYIHFIYIPYIYVYIYIYTYTRLQIKINWESCIISTICSKKYSIRGLLSQNQVSRAAGISQFLPQYLWDVITCSSTWCLLLAQLSSEVDPAGPVTYHMSNIFQPWCTRAAWCFLWWTVNNHSLYDDAYTGILLIWINSGQATDEKFRMYFQRVVDNHPSPKFSGDKTPFNAGHGYVISSIHFECMQKIHPF